MPAQLEVAILAVGAGRAAPVAGKQETFFRREAAMAKQL
jgi:hypothetical protein